MIIDLEFRSLIPPLAHDELAGLEASVKLEGCRDPLVVWGSKGILLDGHNRHTICTRERIPFRTVEREFIDRSAAKLWIIQNQLGRRNLSDLDRIALARQAESLIAEKAKANVRAAQEASPKRSEKASVISRKPIEPVHTNVEAAKLAGVSEQTYAKGKAILDTGSPELVQAVREKKASISAAAEVATLPPVEQKAVVAQGEAEILATAKRIKAEKVEQRRQEREARRRAEMEARAAEAARELPGYEDRWDIFEGDCVDILGKRSDKTKARLIFADPPYNIGIQYGDHYNDSRPFDEFEESCRDWMVRASHCLTWDGSFWILIGWEWAHQLACLGTEIGLHLRQTLVWYEAFGVNTTRMFNRCSRALLWFTKHRETFVFNDHAPEIRRPSDRQAKYNDPRANPDGKLWDDVWGLNPPVPRVTGTSLERIPDFPTQLPLSLLRPIVACATEPGDIVIDPFCGSGSMGVACLELGRKFLGIELSPTFANLARKRLQATRIAS
jgi:DNA modification methylase